MDRDTMSYQFHGENEAAEWRKGIVEEMRDMRTDIKTILSNMVTRPEVERMLDRKADTAETRTWRDWQRSDYQRIDRYPQDMRDQRNSVNVSMQTLSQFLVLAVALAALVVSLIKP